MMAERPEFECEAHGRPCQKAVTYIAELEAKAQRLQAIEKLAKEQSNDGGLWFCAEVASEVYLQDALRRLHVAIEESEG